MRLAELKKCLAERPEWTLRFVLPDGRLVPAHAHVTEVARIDKRFIDCGGTLRTDSFCRFQTWVADDVHHRLTAAKLLRILGMAESIVGSDFLEVDIEHEAGWISQFPLDSIKAEGAELVLNLSERHTACLAEDQCVRPPAAAQPITLKPRPIPIRS